MGSQKGQKIMKSLTTVSLALALLTASAFAGNDKNYTYLALGDSIAFGMNPLLLPPYSNQLPTPPEREYLILIYIRNVWIFMISRLLW